MNVPDKLKFYLEAARVLKPGGRLVFHDVFRGTAKEEPSYPCPWANEQSMSHLCSVDDARLAIATAGLQVVEWKDTTDMTIAWFEKAKEKMAHRGPPPLGVHLLMGENAREKVANHTYNLRTGRTIVVMGVAVKRNSKL